MPATLQPGQARVTHIVPDSYTGPSEGGPAPEEGGGGSFLTRPVGPLPMWIWLIAGAGLTILFVIRAKKNAANQTANQPLPAATGLIDPNTGNQASLSADPNALSDAAALANAINNLDTTLKNQQNLQNATPTGSTHTIKPADKPWHLDIPPVKYPGKGGPAIPTSHIAASRYQPALVPLNSFSQPGGPGYSPLLGHRGIPVHRGVSVSQDPMSPLPSNLAGRAERFSFQDRPAVTARQPMARSSARTLPVSGSFSRKPIPHPTDPNTITRNVNARRVA